MKAHSMVFEGASPFQTLSIGSFPYGHVRYIPYTEETSHLVCQVNWVLLQHECFSSNV